MKHSFGRWSAIFMPACILLIAVLLRVLYFNELQQTPEFSHPIYDPEYNAYWARSLATGDWTVPAGMADPEIRSTPHGRPPGYPWFLAAVYWIFGVNDYMPRIIQMGIGALNALLLYFIGKKIFDRRTGFIAGLLMAVYWVFPYFEGLLTYPVIAIFLLQLLILTLLRWQQKTSLLLALLVGVLMGVFALLRPNGLLMFPFLLLWMAWRSWAHSTSLRRALLALGITVCACGCVLAPPFIRNYLVAHDTVFISSYGGINLYVGNHPGASMVEPHIPELMEIAGIEHWSCFDYPSIVRGLGSFLGKEHFTFSEANHYFYEKAFSFILKHPGKFIANLAFKTLLFFGPQEITNDTVLSYDKAFSPVLKYLPGFPWVFAFFLFGLFLTFALTYRRRQDQEQDPLLSNIVLLLLIFASYTLSVIIYFVAGRYRVPLIPLMLLFSAVGLNHLYGAVVQLRRKSLFIGCLSLLILVPAAHYNFSGYSASLATWHLRRGMAYAAGGDMDRAEDSYQTARELGAESAIVYANLARLYLNKGAYEAGIQAYREGLQSNPDNTMLNNNLGYELYRLGHAAEGAEYFEHALRINPRFVLARINLGNAKAEMEDLDGALTQFEEALRLDPKNADALYNVGRILFLQEDLEGAMAYYQQSLAIHPNHVLSLNNLGYCYEQKGDMENALNFYSRALEIDPQCITACHNMATLLLTWEKNETMTQARLHGRDLLGQSLMFFPDDGLLHEKWDEIQKLHP